MMRAKMKVADVKKESYGEILEFTAVSKSDGYPEDGSDENNTYAHFTPDASCRMVVNNPALHGRFEVGQEFYVDFTPAK